MLKLCAVCVHMTVVLIPFIDEVGRREGEGGEAGMGGCGVDPLH